MIKTIYLSEAASLALHSMIYIAKKKQAKTSVKEIAKSLNASESHLAKVLQQLAKIGLVTSVRGPKGGFVIAKSLNEISLLDIYEAIEGNIPKPLCSLSLNSQCPFNTCIFDGLLKNITKQLRDYFSNNTLESIINKV